MAFIVIESTSDLILVFRPPDDAATTHVLGDLSNRWATLLESTIEGCMFTDGTILRVYRHAGSKFLLMRQTDLFKQLMKDSLACGLLVNPIEPIAG